VRECLLRWLHHPSARLAEACRVSLLAAAEVEPARAAMRGDLLGWLRAPSAGLPEAWPAKEPA